MYKIIRKESSYPWKYIRDLVFSTVEKVGCGKRDNNYSRQINKLLKTFTDIYFLSLPEFTIRNILDSKFDFEDVIDISLEEKIVGSSTDTPGLWITCIFRQSTYLLKLYGLVEKNDDGSEYIDTTKHIEQLQLCNCKHLHPLWNFQYLHPPVLPVTNIRYCIEDSISSSDLELIVKKRKIVPREIWNKEGQCIFFRYNNMVFFESLP